MIKKIRVLIVLLVSLMSSVLTVDIARADTIQPQSVASNEGSVESQAHRIKILAFIRKRNKEIAQARRKAIADQQRAARQRSVEVGAKQANTSANNPVGRRAKPSQIGSSDVTVRNINQSAPTQPLAFPVQPTDSNNANAAYQKTYSAIAKERRIADTSPSEILLLKVLKGQGADLSITDAQNLADVVLDYGGVDSVKSGIFGTILDVRKADKEYRQIRDMFTEFLLEASRKRCTEAVKLLEDILKKLNKTMLHGMCADFISLTNFLHDHLLSEKIIKYRNKFLKKLNRLKMLDERIFIKGLITKVTEDDVGCLTAELSGLIIHEARNALLSKSQKSEASKLAALRIIKKEISIFITAFAIGHYKLAKSSLKRIASISKVHGIEEFGSKFVSHIMSFPAVNLILKNIK